MAKKAKKTKKTAKTPDGVVMVVWNVRLPPAVIAAVKRAAKTERKTSSDIVREALAKRIPQARAVAK